MNPSTTEVDPRTLPAPHLVDPESDEPDLGPVDEQPAVARLPPPADVTRVLPQQPNLRQAATEKWGYEDV